MDGLIGVDARFGGRLSIVELVLFNHSDVIDRCFP